MQDTPDLLESRIRALYPPGVVVRVARDWMWDADLFPEESAVVSRAVPRRRREFSAGRAAVRMALADLGQGPEPLLPDRDRVPRWPAGFVGSVSHTRQLCAAAVTPRAVADSLGLDLEELGPLPEGVAERVCTHTERAQLAAWSRALGTPADRVVFSVKEAVYKAWFPATRRFLGFEDVEVELLPGASRYQARVLAPDASSPETPVRFSGGFLVAGDHLVSAAWVSARSRAAGEVAQGARQQA